MYQPPKYTYSYFSKALEFHLKVFFPREYPEETLLFPPQIFRDWNLNTIEFKHCLRQQSYAKYQWSSILTTWNLFSSIYNDLAAFLSPTLRGRWVYIVVATEHQHKWRYAFSRYSNTFMLQVIWFFPADIYLFKVSNGHCVKCCNFT